jgi:fatty-acyl-CoA synthase
VIGAFIVPTAPGKVTEEALAAHCAAGLARYKCPRLYHLLAALPRTATGKVQKHALAALISAETAS